MGPTISSQSTLLIVLALVRDKASHPVFALAASHFALTDDGVRQKLTLVEESGSQPLALVVVVVAVVAFDSRPGVIQEFTWNLDRAAQAVADTTTKCERQHSLDDCSDTSTIHRFSDGENGAAIHDSLSEAVRLLDLISRDY